MRIAREQGALTIGVAATSVSGVDDALSRYVIAALTKEADGIILDRRQEIGQDSETRSFIENQFNIQNTHLSLAMLVQALVSPGKLGWGFDDLREFLTNIGPIMVGLGVSRGENAGIDAARCAISAALTKGDLGDRILIIMSLDDTLSIHDINDAAKFVLQAANDNSSLIFQTLFDPNLAGAVRIGIFAGGFSAATKPGERTRMKMRREGCLFDRFKDLRRGG